MNKYILKITCPDKRGIVAHIAQALFEHEGNITSSHQFSDPDTHKFFLRLIFEIDSSEEKVLDWLKPLFKKYQMEWHLQDVAYRSKVLILCSKQDHCLSDILSKWRRGSLRIDIPAIVSNHPDLGTIASWYNLPFYHLPITTETKAAQEDKIRELILKEQIDYIVLARYMQILSPAFCEEFAGRIINIHHSFLPAFVGANPYLQAFKRGVKMIGATAHFVTPDLDEGPIILQEAIRVHHNHTVEDLVRYGSDIESVTLSRALKYVVEQRVFIDGNKTVVF